MTQKAISEVRAVEQEWLAAMRAKNIDTLLNKVTDDIKVVHPNGKTVQGTHELRADFERFFRQFKLEQSVVTDETVIAGEWAFDMSAIRSKLVPLNGGDTRSINSKVLTLLREQKSEWRIARVMSVLIS